DVQVLNEPGALGIPCDAERARHDLADDAGDVLAIFIGRHAVQWLRIVDDEIDDRARRFEIARVRIADGNAELVLDCRKELLQCPAHRVSGTRRETRVIVEWNVAAHRTWSNRVIDCRQPTDAAVY